MRKVLAMALAFSASASAAELGKLAPDFTLPDLDGKPVKLSDYRGKVVVLEWFNPGCPYVRAAHTRGSLVDAAAKASARGVVWLAVNSGAPGKQGYGVETNRAAAREWKILHPILLDESGATGKAYGATNTPHMFVVDREGRLVYRGAVDNSPDGERGAPRDGKLVEHMAVALDEVLAGRPVALAETKAYGCTVKYAP
jgi:peroxiredoxin